LLSHTFNKKLKTVGYLDEYKIIDCVRTCRYIALKRILLVDFTSVFDENRHFVELFEIYGKFNKHIFM